VLPALLLAAGLVAIRRWWDLVRTRRGLAAVGGLLVGLAVTLGPLAYQHLAHPDLISRRGENISLWKPEDGLLTRAGLIAGRYLGHFSPRFLFYPGNDVVEVESPAGFGQYPGYVAPLLIVGLVALALQARRSVAARVALCWLILFPLGDAFFKHHIGAEGPAGDDFSTLRSAPGMCGIVLVAAVGGVVAWRALAKRARPLALVAASVFGVIGLSLDVAFLHYYFGAHNERYQVFAAGQADLVEACAWLRPRLAQADAVFVTRTGLSMPYIIMMVTLDYDPRQWFRDERVVEAHDIWDYYQQVGKLYFPPTSQTIKSILNNGRPDRVIVILRPVERGLSDEERRVLTGNTRPAYQVLRPGGRGGLVIYDCEL
jgi:hypothetical protein